MPNVREISAEVMAALGLDAGKSDRVNDFVSSQAQYVAGLFDWPFLKARTSLTITADGTSSSTLSGVNEDCGIVNTIFRNGYPLVGVDSEVFDATYQAYGGTNVGTPLWSQDGVDSSNKCPVIRFYDSLSKGDVITYTYLKNIKSFMDDIASELVPAIIWYTMATFIASINPNAAQTYQVMGNRALRAAMWAFRSSSMYSTPVPIPEGQRRRNVLINTSLGYSDLGGRRRF
jgi:hypothetical protein